ncbi:MAG TPA: alpha-2-macroglobulin family protein [Thermoanaerobaculia bacterium]
MRRARRLARRIPLLALILLAAPACGPARAMPAGPAVPAAAAPPGWAEVERLLDEQKLAAAAEALDRFEAAARERGDDAELARALVRRTQVAVALGGYATAVEALRAREWPEEPLARAAVELYDAFALGAYLDQSGWEIAQRERVVSGGELDLALATSDQLAAEIDRAFARVWTRGERLGEVAADDFPYLEPNDYPAGIRPTLRDAVGYLWAEQLAATSRWSPAELEELWKLDLAALVDGTAVEPTAERLGDASFHPLARLASLLGELERWHRARGDSGAALEARLERLRLLFDAFDAEEDRARIRAALAASLPEFRRAPWWAMGMARLASLWRQSDEPEALVRAREIAREGEAAFPGSPGALACRREREEIEASAFELEAMAIDAAERRSLAVRHRNLARLHLRAYRLPGERFEETPVRWRGWSEERIRPLLRGQPLAEWTVELPATADFRDHRTYVTPPLAARGRYLVVASAEPGFARRGNRLQAVELAISDIVLLTETTGDGRLALRALSGAGGAPLAGVDVLLYASEWERLPRLVERRATDAAGFVELAPQSERRRSGGFAVVVRDLEDEVVWQAGHGPWASGAEREPILDALLFTDRAIYRPGQTLYWKALLYESPDDDGEPRAAAGRAVTVRLLDASNERIVERTVTANDFGTASGTFEIPTGRLLGNWWVEIADQARATIAVEEYKRPTFEVTLAPPAGEPRLNRPVELAGEARYYFGLPVAAGRVAWRVVREPLWQWGWRGFGPIWEPPPPRTIASGAAELDADGRFSVRFTAAADERGIDDCGCFRYRIEAEVTDEGGETRAGSLALSLGRVAVRLALAGAPPLLVAGGASALELRREDLDGAPRAGETAWRLVELLQPERAALPADVPEPVDPERERFATPGDRLRPRWAEAPASEELLAGWRAGREVARGALRHGEDGRAALALPVLAPGAYRLVAETRDRHGEAARLEHALVAAPPPGSGAARLALPLELRFTAPAVEIGGTARLFVHSGLPGQTVVVEIARRGRVVDRRTLVAGRDAPWIELPVGAADRGGLGARATLVADHQVVARQASVEVPWSDKELTVELASFRDRMEPGASETFRVLVKGPDGAPLGAGAAELLASMYDRSLDLFRPHSAPLGDAIWPLRGAPEPLQHALGSRGPVWGEEERWQRFTEPPSYSADGFVAIDPYGVGGPGVGGQRVMTMRAEAMTPAPAAKSADAVQEQIASVTAESPLLDEPSAPAVTLRTDFAETAFWRPHLVTDADGAAAIEFRVPDSLTSWKLWISAWTRELASGYLEREVETAKELMVRPYLPRFLREGDRAEIRVAVNNAAARELAGEVRFAVVDPASGEDLSATLGLPAGGGTAPFRVGPGGGAEVAFPLVAPRGVRPLAVRVEARAGGLADGELRALPLLPSRLRLVQSRFAALGGGERRELVFDDMRTDDPTRIDEQLVVTVDAQLLHGVLAALPYLVDYPYECTEQTMNRFAATAILDALFAGHPSVAAAAKALAARETRWERFDIADPNRRLALEETPWRREARGGTDSESGEDPALLRVLDPAVARAVRAEALAQLEQAQLPSGAFPWFPGGPPSPYITLYLMAGFARVAELGGEIPDEMVRRAWRYLAGEIERDWWQRARKDDCCWELLTFANYVASSYPDPAVMGDALPPAKRRDLLDFSFRHWKRHAPQSKLQLALTLARRERPKEARLVLDAVMDSAKTDRDLGTYWAPEERAWLWYNDTIETHAWALRALGEIAPEDPRRAGLVQWLFLQKQLNHWKSTKATAEALFSLVRYLEDEELLGARQEVAVTLGGATTALVFAADSLGGSQRQLVLVGEAIVPARDAVTVVEQRTPGLAFASATWRYTSEVLPAESRGDLFAVERRWFRRVRQGTETTLVPLDEGERLAVGDELEVQLAIRAKAAAEYVHLRDPRPAGLEPDRADSGWRWDLGLAYYEETRDSGSNFFFEWLPAGEYTLEYRLRANVAGTFRAAPAELQSMYAPEFAAHSAGGELTIAP